MRNLLEAERYVREEWHEREMVGWRRDCWLFAVMAQEVAEEGSWRAVDLAGVPVVVWNCGGELRAYLNVCSHRHSPLCLQSAGRGRLQCPYHGWIYDEEGRVSAIPSRPKFEDLTVERVQELGLKRYRVGQVGAFVWVALEETVPPLEEYLGEATGWLREMSAGCGERVGGLSMRYEGNWKLVIENTLESYHAACVHPETLYPGRGHDSVFEATERHSRMMEGNSATLERSWRLIEKSFAGRGQVTRGYCHTSIFPNLNIGSTYGSSYVVMRFVPEGVRRTLVEVNLYGCGAVEGGSLPGGADATTRKWYGEGVMKFVEQVLGRGPGGGGGAQRGG
ncbi:MAG: aromatic ring-hydroxylating dioxygenase subunit alpha, partial [Blastochloris sp.]|nr:aromatic ring-hydroxylating dioxygenase subunit alpha [Blastochloris sp.]